MNRVLFEYRALDKAGRQQVGQVIALDQSAAIREVRAKGLKPVKISAAKAPRSLGRRGIKPKHIAQFTYELGTLLDAAVPIGDGLHAIAEQESNPSVRAMVRRIAQRVESGSTVTDALREHERVFGPVYIETVAAAEHAGTLRRSLEHLAENLEWQAETGRRINQALMYPAAVTVALGGGTVFLLAFVVPKFTNMFHERGMELPILTKVLDRTGHSLQHHWWAYLGALVASVMIVRAMWMAPRGRLILDRALSTIPYVGRVLGSLGVTRFSRVLGMSLTSGISLIDAIEQAGRASGRPRLIRETQDMARAVRLGGSLRDAMQSSRVLPVFAKRMFTAGEESAELPKMCSVVARHYEREAEHLSKSIGTLIEPVLIAVLTGIVLVIALGIFIPMWDMASLMR